MLVELRRRKGPSLWAEVDDTDADLVSQHTWWAEAGRNTTYVQTNIRREDGRRGSIRLHTFLTGYKYTDHVDGNGLNNRRSNLRPTDHIQNGHNLRSRTGNSKYKGVHFDRTNKCWKAYITVNRKRINLGTYNTQEDGAHAYNVAAKEHFGARAFLNEVI